MIGLWELRNEEVHGKEEATKQQKRKAKAAISMQALNDLQEIARPSDSFLFYQDVEEEIENAKAAKLEGFILMETRPTYDSVKIWANQANSNFKSIVKWINIGKRTIEQ